MTKVAGEEHYRIPVEKCPDGEPELQEFFRKLWKLIMPYGSKDSLRYLVFCLEENTEEMRRKLLEIVKVYNILTEKVRFADKAECFVSYVIHQSGELLSHNALLIENQEGKMNKYILHKRTRMTPVVTEVKDVSEKTLEDLFAEHAVSSVFLVGDDFEEGWMQQNMRLLKTGKRVFAGKNLYVKGACYLGMDLQAGAEEWIYLGPEKISCNILLKVNEDGKETYVTIAEGGKNWYESDVSLEVLLLDEPKLEFAMVPINKKERKRSEVSLENFPKRPNKTTKLRITLQFTDADHAKLTIQDLGFGEIFPQSDMKYEGELQWEQ